MTAEAVRAMATNGTVFLDADWAFVESRVHRGSMRRWASRAAWIPLLTVVLTTALWMAASALGYRALVVMSGSMRPAVSPGDVVIADVIAPAQARVGDVVSFKDPTRSRMLVTHRVEAIRQNGSQVAFITRGDANTAEERWAIDREGSIGRMRLRVPLVGRAIIVLGQPHVRAGLLAAAVGVLVLGGLGWLVRQRPLALPGPALVALVAALGLVLGFAATRTLSAFSSQTANGSNSFAAAASFCNTPGTQTVYASADAWIDQDKPAQNNGSGATVSVREQVGKNKRALVGFPLPALSGCSVTAATLRLYQESGQATRVLEAYRLTGSWTEAGVTWGNQPGTAGPPSATTAAIGWRSWEATSLVQSMYANGSYGFLVREQTEDSNAAEQRFRTRETTERPELVITLG